MAQGTVVLKLTVEQRKALRELDKFKSQLSGVGKIAGLVGAALGGIGFMAAAKAAIFTRARNRELGVVMEELGKNVGVAADDLYKIEGQVKDLGVTTEMARQVIVDFLRSENDLTKATQLARVAQNAGVIAMQDTATAMQGIMHGIMVLRPQVLRYHGIVISLESAYNRFCDATGRTRDSLSEIEKQQIALNEVLRYGERIQGAYTSAMTEAGKRYRSIMVRYIKEALDAIGEAGMPILGEFVDLVGDIAQRTEEWAEANQVVLKQKVAEWAKRVGDEIRNLVDFTGQHLDQIVMWGKIIVATAIIAKLGKLAYTINLLSKSIGALTWASLGAAGPIGIVVGLFSALAGVTIYLQKKEEERLRSSQQLLGQYGQLRVKIKELQAEYDALANKTGRSAEETEGLRRIERHLIKAKDDLKTAAEALNKVLPSSIDLLSDTADEGKRAADNVRALAENEAMLAKSLKLARFEEELARIKDTEEGLRKLDVGITGRYGAAMSKARTRQEYLQEQIDLLTATVDAYLKTEAASIKQLKGWPIPEQRPGVPVPETPAFAIAAEAWKDALESLHDMRMDLIQDEFEKERAKALEEYTKLRDEIAGAAGLPEGAIQGVFDWTALTKEQQEMLALIEEAYRLYQEKIGQIREKEAEKEQKAAHDRAQDEVNAIMDTLDYKKRLYGWGTDAYIRALETQIDAFADNCEVRLLLEEKLQEALGEKRIRGAEDYRNLLKQQRDEALRVYQDIRDAAVNAAIEGSAAWKDFGEWLTRYFARRVLTEVLDKLFQVKEAAGGMGEGGGILGGSGWLSALIGGLGKLFGGFLGSAQHGTYTTTPGLLRVHANEHAVPDTKLRQTIREELARSGGGGGDIIINIPIEKLTALDGADVQRQLRDGPLHDGLELAAKHRWINLQPREA